MAKILIVDDDPTILNLLNKILLTKGYDVEMASDGGDAQTKLKEQSFDLLMSDVRMEPVDGMTLLKQARAEHTDLSTIMLTAYATVSTAVEAMKEGAFDYIPKPFKIDELLSTVKRAIEYHQSLTSHSGTEAKKYFGNVIAESEVMVKTCEMVKRIAPSQTTVLITGERGTGKEIIAESIHRSSNCADQPFTPFHCAAITAEKTEEELFGTAATESPFESAEGGTLFLDEINQLPIKAQEKLLKALQNKTFCRSGTSDERSINVRLIAATEENLERMVKSGTFLADLYSRLNTISFEIPPLKSRTEDIIPLARFFIEQEADEEDTPPSIDPVARSILQAYSWPGNVRELQNVIQHCLTFIQEGKITKATLPSKLIIAHEENPAAQDNALDLQFEKGKSLKAFLREKEKEYLKSMLDGKGDTPKT